MGHSEVEDAKTGGVEPMGSAVVVPMSRKARDMGHPRLDGAIGRQHVSGRAGPPATSPCAIESSIPLTKPERAKLGEALILIQQRLNTEVEIPEEAPED